MERSEFKNSSEYWTAVVGEALEKEAAGELDDSQAKIPAGHIEPESTSERQQFSPDVARASTEEQEGMLERAFRVMPEAVREQRATASRVLQDKNYRSSSVLLRPLVDNVKTSARTPYLPFRTLSELMKGL